MLLHTEASCDFYLFIFACTAKLHQKHCQLSILCPAVWDTLEEPISELEDQKIPLEKNREGKLLQEQVRELPQHLDLGGKRQERFNLHV